ncbi:NAD-dependent epimerase/dehydratase family protein [Bailinhaonella thermotolerans]|uniref:NAD-dependent epimerase/dehydratase family protein n=1 Tax=Bailinhaonella thermotolerans TaxID=1070861 RepID=A0A3A4AZV0_9ACTN|nr:NAD-dependent epimerase/dehydratase family protein [Bailinhaonella thermotolerans]RJL35927.1 NAD-dependent epimerase/dehydratase family protein [Bailinhaonella thermotolerans]
MRILVTGASGYVGSHAVAALRAAGHDLRLLVREPRRAAGALAALGVGEGDFEVARGDMCDPGSVERALDGCDAVLHAAADLSYGGDGRANVEGTANVVGRALALGADPVVHVSSVAVFVPSADPVITTGSALARPRSGYARSKVEAERYVRGLQDEGRPVTIVYPGGVTGPHQPRLDAMMNGLARALNEVWAVPRAGVGVIDVRDLAIALERCFVPGLGPRRLLLGGHYLDWDRLGDLCDELTGVRCRRVTVPHWAFRLLGAAFDAARRLRPIDYPLSRDVADVMLAMAPTDDEPALTALDMRLRPVAETVEDSLRWLAEHGHLNARAAGRLASHGRSAEWATGT